MMAKRARSRLRHPILTSAHLLFACLRLHDQRHWDLARNLPMTAASVWSRLRDTPAWIEPSEDYFGVQIGVSAKMALERAESEIAKRKYSMIGTNSLMWARLTEKEGPVRTLLDAANAKQHDV